MLEHAVRESAPLADVRVTTVTMPKEDPTWRFALGARAESVGILVEIEDADGITGIGYASEVPHLGYDLDVMQAVVREKVVALKAMAAFERRALLGTPWQHSLPAPVRSLFDMAWHDLLAKRAGVPLYRLLGGRDGISVRVNRILAIKTPEEMAKVAVSLQEEGYDHFKIKVDNHSLATDVDRVAAVRDAVGTDAVLTVDANQSYSAKEAVVFAKAIALYGVQIFEQPVPQRDIAGLKWVRFHTDMTVEADEAADSLTAVAQMLEAEAVDAVSLKLSKLGGIDSLLTAANLCEARGIGHRIGAHVGSRIMNAAALHAAAALPRLEPSAEAGEFARLLNDPATGLEVEGGAVSVPTGPGLGVTLHPDLVRG
jgi:L-alanine-DL-glutamate epimerase-like enolase superfamily enzyme